MNTTRIASEAEAARGAGLTENDVLAATVEASRRFDERQAIRYVRDHVLRAVTATGDPEFSVDSEPDDDVGAFRLIQDVDEGVQWAVTVERCVEEVGGDAH